MGGAEGTREGRGGMRREGRDGGGGEKGGEGKEGKPRMLMVKDWLLDEHFSVHLVWHHQVSDL